MPIDRRSVVCLLIVSFAVCAIAQVAEADSIRGDGFAFGFPDGFHELASADYADSVAGHLTMAGGLAVRGEPSIQTYCAGRAQRPDAVLLVARINLKDDGRMHSARGLQRYVLDNLHASDDLFDHLMALDRVTLTPKIHDGLEALEMSHDGVRGPLGLLEEPAVRAMAIVGDGYLLVFVLVVTDDEALSPDEAWGSVMSALVVDPPGAFVRSALLYGGTGLFGLILFVLLLRLLASRRLARAPAWAYRAGARGKEAWGHTVLAPPLHPAGGRPTGVSASHSGGALGSLLAAAQTRSLRPASAGASAPQAGVRPGLKRTLPQGRRPSA